MRQFTTPTINLDIEGLDLTGWHTETSITQGCAKLTIDDADCVMTETGCRLTINLTQEQTGIFEAHKAANVQVRFINATGTAGATEIKAIKIDPVLVGGVIEYD